ncbi:BTAD domain-containing putative transcriptional regulator [Streptomyces sp. NPDC001530]|uniref:AfsR/SARP family transcriptional regulator n=1 Tax=Streptomyces sp. NPDC001530 TaxID=3364582 RepID=UPI0036805DDC
MDIGILGPLTVRSTGGQAVPTAPKPRQLLALLAARAGLVVPVDLLVDELWQDDPPAHVLTVLQTYIMQLRQSLARARGASTAEVAREILPYSGWGYRLVVDRERSDASVFARYAEQGRRALLNGENDQASALLRRALQVWRGPALADVRVGAHLLAHRTSLTESRLGVIEQRVEADLRIGRHHELIDELTGLVERHPLHENLCALLIIALYRAGQPARALDAFERLRTNLREALGIDPSPRVRNLRQAVLDATPRAEPGEPLRAGCSP